MWYLGILLLTAVFSCTFGKSSFILHLNATHTYFLAVPTADHPVLTKIDGKFDWSRVVGGSTAANGQFPYIASLRRSPENSHFCGGSIVSSFYILTAAHCTVGYELINKIILS